jgi:hypothetical protein
VRFTFRASCGTRSVRRRAKPLHADYATRYHRRGRRFRFRCGGGGEQRFLPFYGWVVLAVRYDAVPAGSDMLSHTHRPRWGIQCGDTGWLVSTVYLSDVPERRDGRGCASSPEKTKPPIRRLAAIPAGFSQFLCLKHMYSTCTLHDGPAARVIFSKHCRPRHHTSGYVQGCTAGPDGVGFRMTLQRHHDFPYCIGSLSFSTFLPRRSLVRLSMSSLRRTWVGVLTTLQRPANGQS